MNINNFEFGGSNGFGDAAPAEAEFAGDSSSNVSPNNHRRQAIEIKWTAEGFSPEIIQLCAGTALVKEFLIYGDNKA